MTCEPLFVYYFICDVRRRAGPEGFNNNQGRTYTHYCDLQRYFNISGVETNRKKNYTQNEPKQFFFCFSYANIYFFD